MNERMTISEVKIRYPHKWVKLTDIVWKNTAVMKEGTVIDVRGSFELPFEERFEDTLNGYVWYHTNPEDVNTPEERFGVTIHGINS